MKNIPKGVSRKNWSFQINLKDNRILGTPFSKLVDLKVKEQ